MQILQDFNKTYIAGTTAETQVFTGAGALHSIVIGTAGAGIIKVIDGITGSTANVATLEASAALGSYEFDCQITSGLRIVPLSATSAFTVMWKQS